MKVRFTRTAGWNAVLNGMFFSIPAGPAGTYTQTRTWTYSGTDQRLKSMTLPETGIVSYTYNSSSGLLATKTDAKGTRKEFTYDTKQRVTQVKYFNGSTEIANTAVTYSYDTNPYDAAYTQYGNGRPTAVQYPIQIRCAGGFGTCYGTVTEMFSYTQDGRMTKKKMRISRYGTADLEATYGFDSEGRLSTITYPNNGGTYTYTYDGMGRLGGMTDQNNQPQVSNISYGPASELLTFGSETRQYNTLGQLTRITIPQITFLGQTWPGTDLEYRYSATQNNGQIVSRKDYVSGEEVTYVYDSLTRLTSAASTIMANTQTFNYDGWGNRTGLNASTWSYDGATNRLLGAYSYDANGNMTSMPKGAGSMTMGYDVENRLLTTYQGYTPLEQYAYGADNRRVYKRNVQRNAEQFFFWSGGQVLGIYSPNLDANEYMTGLTTVKTYTYFGSRRLGERPDRLGSDVYNGTSANKSYYPYGEEVTPTSGDGYKFATYYRDSVTGLDYADQRYYSSTAGRFLTPDPYVASGGVTNPASWNRYAYVGGDPVNRTDSTGQMWQPVCFVDDVCDDTDANYLWEDLVWMRWWYTHVPAPGGFGYLPKITKERRSAYVKTILDVVATAVAAANSEDQNGAAYPKYMRIVDDTYTCFGKVAERDVTYQLYDSNDEPLPSGVITEHLFQTDYDVPIYSGVGITPNTSSGQANGRFEDTISIQFGYPRTYLQSFTVRGASIGLTGFLDIPIFVRGFGGDFSILSIEKTASYVDINGNRGTPKKCD